jgi:5-(carboxyamino)imidazole ribonucleotide synthase
VTSIAPVLRAAPDVALGVLGGGQLGRMFAQAAQSMGYRVVVLDPDPYSPAGAVADEHLRFDYRDRDGLATLAARCQAVTTEFENVPAQALDALVARVPVRPAVASVAVCQHRAAEKVHFAKCGVPCAPYAEVREAADLARAAPDLFPGILKTSRLGYDGKGQVGVADVASLASAWEALGGVPCVLEKRLDLRCELSVIVARDGAGHVVHLPVQHNLHRDGILAVTRVPSSDVPAASSERAVALAQAIASGLDHVGVLCVEFFVLADGSVLANEMAPRPHNSGHYSIDACDASQFELQVRTLAGLPLPQPRQHSAAVMLNLLGDLWFGDAGADARTPAWETVLALPGAHLHLYGKREPRRGRKMGHLTLTAADEAAALAVAREAVRRLGLDAF